MQTETSEMLAGGDMLLWLAGILMFAGVLMTSIRALRVFLLGGGVAALAYLMQNDAPALAFLLALLFVLANGVQLALLIRRARRGVMLTEEQALFDHILQISDQSQQRRLRDLLTWRDIRQGEVLMEQGQLDPPLIYIARGTAGVDVSGRKVGECTVGDFLGEMSVLSGERASATVVAGEPMRIVQFDRDALGQFAREVPEVGSALSGALNRGLSAKIGRMNAAAGTADNLRAGAETSS
ncbi:Crp/Fnr family transcriptional regulator [Qipengyuania sp. MTN3-11]|uniref:Crp/Fnr family transcriptional regulator n=1 Tax=Qipengyuania sp. MTN3-11 TaxID=3056557 RepID=UPI0036F40FAD